jgi:hypothetical protein
MSGYGGAVQYAGAPDPDEDILMAKLAMMSPRTRKKSLLWALVLLGASQACYTQQGPCAVLGREVKVSPAFYTGWELNGLTDQELGIYAAGYVDALQAATMIGVTKACRQAVQKYLVGRSQAELTALIRKYLREHPDRLDGQSHALFYNALFSQRLHDMPDSAEVRG